MIRFEFGAADLAGLRFAHSPMAEVVASAFALRSGSWPYAAWRSNVDLSALPTFRAVLLGPLGYAPDFLTPVPAVSRPTLDDELRVVAATSPDVVAAQALAGWPGHTPPPALTLFATDPRAALDRLIAEIRAYAAAAIAPLWPRLRAAADAEIAARFRRAAESGPRSLVDALHPRLAWDGDSLLIDYADKSGEWGRDGHDLTLLPTGFAGNDVYAMREGGSALWYAPRGFGNVWATPPREPAALSALLGPTRAAVLTLLGAPHSTGQVAAALGLAPATASHHLTTLRDAGLVAASRAGRRLLYERTTLGDGLTDARHLSTSR